MKDRDEKIFLGFVFVGSFMFVVLFVAFMVWFADRTKRTTETGAQKAPVSISKVAEVTRAMADTAIDKVYGVSVVIPPKPVQPPKVTEPKPVVATKNFMRPYDFYNLVYKEANDKTTIYSGIKLNYTQKFGDSETNFSLEMEKADKESRNKMFETFKEQAYATRAMYMNQRVDIKTGDEEI